MGIQPGSHRRPAQRQLAQVRQALLQMTTIVLQHGHPAGKLLPEGQRRGILKVGAADFDNIAEAFGFLA